MTRDISKALGRAARRLPKWARTLLLLLCAVAGLSAVVSFLDSYPGFAKFLFVTALILVPFVLYGLKKDGAPARVRCPNCFYDGNGKFIRKGSTGVEVLLWLSFLVPGLIYSVWRSSNKRCGGGHHRAGTALFLYGRVAGCGCEGGP